MAELTDTARQKIESANIAFLATLMPDGSPQVSPVWVDLEEGLVLVNTARGRAKERNCRRDPRVAISIADREDPYNHVDVRGRVVETVEGDEAEAHIDKLAKKYLDEDVYPWKDPSEARVLLKIEPLTVHEELE